MPRPIPKVKKKRLLKALAEGNSTTEAAKKAELSRNTAAKLQKHDPEFQADFMAILDKAGVTDDAIAKVVSEAFRAKKKLVCDKMLVDAGADHAVRLKAADLGATFRGRKIEKHEVTERRVRFVFGSGKGEKRS